MPRSRNILLACIALAVTAGLWALLAGCGTPRERYEALSFFFDGVPDPDAPAKKSGFQPTLVTGGRTVRQHQPYMANQCDRCHQTASGDILQFNQAWGRCITCHQPVTTGHRLMHGPVALAACNWCHEPHESTEPALLKGGSIKLCTQCHDQQLLGNTPQQHLDGETDCLSCHFGHGGEERYFLKSMLLPATNPTETAPATQPGTPLMLGARAAREGAP